MSRDLISGGASVATKERLVVVRTEDGQRVEQTALLKRTSAAEVSALRAATQVPGASAIPEIVDAGVDVDGCWLLIPFYDGGPAEAEIRVPGNVVESLARMHAYYLDSPVPEHIPVVDQSWWQARCAQSVERLTALGTPATRAIAARVETWAPHQSRLETRLPSCDRLQQRKVHRIGGQAVQRTQGAGDAPRRGRRITAAAHRVWLLRTPLATGRLARACIRQPRIPRPACSTSSR